MASSTANTAHKCFSIAELTSRIIGDNIYEPDDLLHVALSCRAFLEPALDSLWYELNTLLPLLRLFPEDVFSYERNNPKFKRAPIGDDWTRFHYHADRVRDMEIEEDATVNEDILKTLSLHKRQLWLFPNLRQLNWSIYEDPTFPYVMLFLGPRIQMFQFYPTAAVTLPHLRSLLRTLIHECPHLHSFTAYHVEGEEPEAERERATLLGRELSTFIMSTPSLRSLSIESSNVILTSEALEQLAVMPCLSHLLLPLESTDLGLIASDERPDMAPGIFPALQRLSAHIRRPESAIPVIRKIMSRELNTMSIHSSSILLSTVFTSIMLAPCIQSTTVTYLSLSFASSGAGVMPVEQYDQYRLMLNTFQPLLSLHNMRYFSVQSPFVEPDDQLLERIGQSWPSLGNLILMPRFRPARLVMHETPRVTLNGIYALVKGCPALIHVTCSIDARSAHTFQFASSPLPLSDRRSILSFDFVLSPINQDDMDSMAIALNTLSPGPLRIETTDPWWFTDPSASVQAAGIDVRAYGKEMDRRETQWEQVDGCINMLRGSKVSYIVPRYAGDL